MNRRQMIGRAATIPLLAVGGRILAAEAPPKVTEDDPTAMALAYVHDAAASPKRTTDAQQTQFCDNCLHYGTSTVDDWGTSAVIPGKLVAAKGWCMVWVAKAS